MKRLAFIAVVSNIALTVSMVLNFVLAYELKSVIGKYEAAVEAHRQTIREEGEYLDSLRDTLKGKK